jgi:hypothetical protein
MDKRHRGGEGCVRGIATMDPSRLPKQLPGRPRHLASCPEDQPMLRMWLRPEHCQHNPCWLSFQLSGLGAVASPMPVPPRTRAFDPTSK